MMNANMAKLLGLSFYDCGRPCKYGHGNTRRTSSGDCPTCEIGYYHAQTAEKKQANLQKRKLKYHSDAAYNAKIREQTAAYAATRYACDPEKRERQRERCLKHYYANPDQYAFNRLRRRRGCANSTPAWLTEKQRAEMFGFYRRCKQLSELSSQPHEVDHIVPLLNPKVCGLNVPWNLATITRVENRTKGNRLPDEDELICRAAPGYQT